jgi:trans-aconitate methyltransferase
MGGIEEARPPGAAGPGPDQVWTPGYLVHGAFVTTWGRELVDLLDPRPGERVLDLGCGDGAVAAAIAARGAEVVGIDAAPELVALARRRGLDVRLADAQALDFEAAFDAVFSNAALHWMPDLDAVLGGVRRALRPGGRFVGEMGGHGNVAAIRVAIQAVLTRRALPTGTPWTFPTREDFAARLTRQGFAVDLLTLFPRPAPLPTGIAGWLETFAGPMLGRVPEADRATAIEEIAGLLRPALCDREGRWTADYVRLRFVARAAPAAGGPAPAP